MVRFFWRALFEPQTSGSSARNWMTSQPSPDTMVTVGSSCIGIKEMEWEAIIERWRVANEQLIRAASAISAQTGRRTLIVSGGEPITLEFLVGDYLDHLIHHLRHIGIAAGDAGADSDGLLSCVVPAK